MRPLGALTIAALLAPSLACPLAAQETGTQEMGVEAELVVARQVEDRAPMGEAASFPADVGQVTAWSRITGAEGTTVEHVWRHGENEWVVPLEIGGSPWRTWSTKTIPPEWTGEWTVEVRDARGNVVASTTFTVGEG